MEKIESLKQQIASGKLPPNILEKKQQQLEYLTRIKDSAPRTGWVLAGFPWYKQVTYWYEGSSLITKNLGTCKRFNTPTILNRIVSDEEAASLIDLEFEVGQVWESPIDKPLTITSVGEYLEFDDGTKLLPYHFIKEFINDKYFRYNLKGDHKDYDYYLRLELLSYGLDEETIKGVI